MTFGGTEVSLKRDTLLTLFNPGVWGGGGGILPAATFNVTNVANIEAKATKLGGFF